jgi:hypothetical protein
MIYKLGWHYIGKVRKTELIRDLDESLKRLAKGER